MQQSRYRNTKDHIPLTPNFNRSEPKTIQMDSCGYFIGNKQQRYIFNCLPNTITWTQTYTKVWIVFSIAAKHSHKAGICFHYTVNM